MIVRKLIDKAPIKSRIVKIVAGSILVGLLVSLGMVGILKLFSISIPPAIPIALAAVSAAVFAAKMKQENEVSK